MAFGWYSRLFGVLDFAWWALVTTAVTIFCVAFVRSLVSSFASLFITVTIFCYCYLSLMSTVGLMKATGETFEERGPESRIRLCKGWLCSSWISFGLSALYFISFIFQPSSWYNLNAVFGVQFVLRAIGLFCVHRYISELKEEIRSRALTEIMIPLTSGATMEINGITLMSVYSTGRPEKTDDSEDLPKYEELMQKEQEANYVDCSPPTYETAIGASR